MRVRNYYDILGIDPDAAHADIRSAYYIRARVIHPDRFDAVAQRKEWEKANEMLAELNEAYAVLRDSKKRSEYGAEMGYTRRAATSAPNETRSSAQGTQTASQSSSPKSPPEAEPSSPDSESQQGGPSYLLFSDLPSTVKDRLLERQRGNGEQLPWRTKTLNIEFACIAGSVAWLGLLFYWTNDYRWGGNQPILYGVITILATCAFAFAALGLWRWKSSPIKGHIFLTPLYFIKVQFDEIWYWGSWQIADIQSVNHYHNGSYTHTTVTFIFDEGSETVKVKGLNSLQHLFDKLKTWGSSTSEAAKRGDLDYFMKHDDFYEIHATRSKASASRRYHIKRWAIAFGIALISGVAVTAFADQLNRYFDDKKSWDDASVNNRVSAYRKYLDNHPSGRWMLEANRRIQSQYDQSSLQYQNYRSRGFDRGASDAVLGILTYAKQTQHYRVRVAFERHNEIPSNVEEQLKNQFGVTNVLSIGDAFSDDRMQSREQQILSSVTSAFRTVIPEDVLDFSDSGQAEGGVVFLITYKVKSGKSLYFRDSDAQISPYSRPYYPGIYLNWDFEIRIPSEQRGYRFTLESNPASEFRYAYSYNSETATIYDRMAESAFDDFQRELVKRLGLIPSNSGTQQSVSDPTPSPTPDVAGTYANQFGTVEITPNAKGFSFALHVGTARCAGEISGNAKWTKVSNAMFRKALDKEVYDDPSSFYYQKSCQLTFKFSADKVQVSQSDGCSYFQGAECDFNGSYRRSER
jgi:hypothetical protein